MESSEDVCCIILLRLFRGKLPLSIKTWQAQLKIKKLFFRNNSKEDWLRDMVHISMKAHFFFLKGLSLKLTLSLKKKIHCYNHGIFAFNFLQAVSFYFLILILFTWGPVGFDCFCPITVSQPLGYGRLDLLYSSSKQHAPSVSIP